MKLISLFAAVYLIYLVFVGLSSTNKSGTNTCNSDVQRSVFDSKIDSSNEVLSQVFEDADDISKLRMLRYDCETIKEAQKTINQEKSVISYTKFCSQPIFLNSKDDVRPDPKLIYEKASRRSKDILEEFNKLEFAQNIIWHQAMNAAIDCGARQVFNEINKFATNESNVESIEILLSVLFDDLENAFIMKDWKYCHFDNTNRLATDAVLLGIKMYFKQYYGKQANKENLITPNLPSISINDPKFEATIKIMTKKCHSVEDIDSYFDAISDKLNKEASNFFGPLQTIKRNAAEQNVIAYKFKFLDHIIKLKN